jgi:hypothetical protein
MYSYGSEKFYEHQKNENFRNSDIDFILQSSSSEDNEEGVLELSDDIDHQDFPLFHPASSTV